MEPLFDKKDIDYIKDALIELSQTISIAESVTSGLVQLAFGSATDASQYYQGGITAYNVAQKYRHLSVEPIGAISCNCVSEQVAKDMALGACRLFTSDWGVGITGYAAPVPESDYKLFAYYAVAFRGVVVISKHIAVLNTEPIRVQMFYTDCIIKDLKAYMHSMQPAKTGTNGTG